MFKVSRTKEAVEDSSGASYISKSGIYDVVINFASVDISKNGAQQVNFNVTWEGNEQTFYGPYVKNNNGDDNDIGIQLITKLAVIADMEDGEDFEFEEIEVKVGKEQKLRTFETIVQFANLPVKMRVQEEYSNYQDKTRKAMVIKSFFREDGASAQEIIEESEVGIRLALEESKYANNITYKDGLTPEDVEAWKEEKRAEASSGGTPKPKARNAAPKRKLFNAGKA